MAAGKAVVLMALTTGLLLSACGGSDQKLMNLRSPHDGPDEFAILPTKPLEMPQDFSQLPPPEPGAKNLVDPAPLDDAVIALGGRPGAGGNDAALASATGRYGVSGSIREQLAAEDSEFRSRNGPRLLERLFGSSTYHRVYGDQAVASDAELERWRRAGARTPSAPPVYDR
ncbi:Beta-barrel assembly machine subunit BamF [Gemmobacter megaterium]|uniref:Beta-barrel assembly machine subunit BamF n=1 Tax=Gemmobacter megaterium TaxID=1086013 RepID=A0A1N7PQ00_9RHOB|nr:DUF3035 domain-containing protein [Gemmobacter megaterium]GGE20529.1 hypothetical protein GCM10011345_27930 [Gemmobacter megaterium]SIT12668.1 Beta-barrel assembly machine subunit BamF [Gemmobacter megaterium]